jgi:hypothetical protein
MGAPTSAILAEIYIQHKEHKQLYQILLKHKITGYLKQKKKTHVDKTIMEFNKQNNNLKSEKNTIIPLIFWTSQYTEETED